MLMLVGEKNNINNKCFNSVLIHESFVSADEQPDL